MRRGVKKSAAIFISFGGIVSITAALFVSVSGGVAGLKGNFSFRKKFWPLNFFPIFSLIGWNLQVFKISQRVLPVCFYHVTFLKDFLRVFN